MKNVGTLRKGLALILSFAMVCTSFMLDLTALKANAADSSKEILNGGQIAQIFTNNTGSAYTVNSGTFSIAAEPGTNVSYSAQAYINSTSGHPTEGVPGGAFGSGTFSATEGNTAHIGTLGGSVVLGPGENMAVVVTFTISGAKDYVAFYPTEGEGGLYTPGWVGCGQAIALTGAAGGTIPTANVTIPSNKIFLNKGESYTLTPSISPAYYRTLTYNASGAAISLSATSGASTVITAQNAGASTVTIGGAGITPPTPLNVVVSEASISGSYTYDGRDIEPVTTVTADRPLSKGSDYQLSYDKNHKNAGRGYVTIVGAGSYVGLNKPLEFDIAKANIDSGLNGAIANGQYTVDPITNVVSGSFIFGGSGGTREQVGQSIYASAELLNVVDDPTNEQRANYTYRLTLTGSGSINFDGTYVLPGNITVSGPRNYIGDKYSMILELEDDSLVIDEHGNIDDIEDSITIIDEETGYALDSIHDIPGNVTLSYWHDATEMSQPTSPGTYRLHLKSDKYTGDLVETFYVRQTIRGAEVRLTADPDSTEPDTYIFKGSSKPINPNFSVFVDGKPLKYEADASGKPTNRTEYTYSFRNDDEIGQGILTIKGAGDYTGTVTKRFNIVPNAAETLEIKIAGKAANKGNQFKSPYAVTYNGKVQEPGISVKLDGTTITTNTTEDQYYSKSFVENTNAGTAKVIITLSPSLGGQKVTATFTIRPDSLERQIGLNPPLFKVDTATDLAYTGSEIKLLNKADSSNPTNNCYELTANDDTLEEYNEANPDFPYDYKITYSANKNVGIAEITATGNGNYKDSITRQFRINERDIASAGVKVVDPTDYTQELTELPAKRFTGDQIQPKQGEDFEIVCDGKKVEAADGYIVSYGDETDNIQTGTGHVYITGTNNFTGEREIPFEITSRSILSEGIKFFVGTELVGTGLQARDALDHRLQSQNYSREYNGHERTASIVIWDGERQLSPAKDYDLLEPLNAVNVPASGAAPADMPTAVIKGKGNYSDDTVLITYNITPKSISDAKGTATVEADNSITLHVTDGLHNLSTPQDYIINDLGYDPSDPNATAGEKTATITGQGNYKDTAAIKYKVGFDLENATFRFAEKTSNQIYSGASVPSIPYQGKGENARIKVNVYAGADPNPLTEGDDYTMTFSPASGYTPGGDVTVDIVANPTSPKYYGQTTTKFHIDKASLSPYVADVSTHYYKEFYKIKADTTSTFTYSFVGALNGGEPVENAAPGTRDISGADISGEPIYEFRYGQGRYNVTSGLNATYAPIDRSSSADPKPVIETVTMVPGTDFILATSEIDTTQADGNIRSITLRTSANTTFAGEKKLYYRIAKPKVSNANDVRIETIADFDYDGQAHKLTENDIVLTDVTTNQPLTPGTDYKVTDWASTNDAACIKPGTITLTIEGQGLYEGTITTTYDIRPVSLTKYHLTTINDIEYDGNSHSSAQLAVRLVDDNGVEVPGAGTEYRLEYSEASPINPGQYTITAAPTPTGTIFAGSASVSTSFKIYADITKAPIVIAGIADGQTFNINAAGTLDREPESMVTVKLKDGSSASFSVSKSRMNAPGGNGSVTVSGTGEFYTGTKTFNNMQVFGDLSDATWSGTIADRFYTGTKIEAGTITLPTLRFGSSTLRLGTDFEISSEGANTYVEDGGIITVAPKSGSYYSGTKDITFNIVYNLNQAVITPSSLPNVPYNGTEQKQAISVSVGGKTLTPETDYNITYSNSKDGATCIAVGLVTVTVSGIRGISVGSPSSPTYQITPVEMNPDKAVINVLGGPFTYDGTNQKPAVEVIYNGKTLSDTEYSASYANNRNAGEATVYISGLGNYSNSQIISESFTIQRRDISTLTPQISDVNYNGHPANPTITLRDPVTGDLVRDTDFEVKTNLSSYVNAQNNIPVNLEGIGNYSGQTNGTFNIIKTDIGNATLENLTAVYTGQNIDAASKIEVYLDGKKLSNDQYTVTFAQTPKNVNRYGFTITPKASSNLGGQISDEFIVTPKPITDVSITVDPIADQAWAQGNPVIPTTIAVKDNGIPLTSSGANPDYSIQVINNTSSGAHDDLQNPPTVIITGEGNYEGERRVTFNIGEPLAGKILFDASPLLFTYNGKEQMPKVTNVRTKDGTPLVEGIDYIISTEGLDTVNAGKNKVIHIQSNGTGFYGREAVNYEIRPKTIVKSDIRVVLDLPRDRDGVYYATYTGQSIEPEATLYDIKISSTKPLREGIDYNTTYRGDTINVQSDGSAGASAWFSFDGNYAVDADNHFGEPYKIVPKPFNANDYTIHFVDNQTIWDYDNGNPVEPEVYVTTKDADGNEIQLTPGVDYKLSYENNIKAGPAKVIVEGLKNFSGSLSADFEIWANLENAQVTIPVQPYTGQRPAPKAQVICGGNLLVQDVDYEVFVEEYDLDRGFARIGTKNTYYTGETLVPFDISFDPTIFTLVGISDTYEYTGNPIKAVGKVVDTNGHDYADNVTWSYESGDSNRCIEPGRVKVTARLSFGDRTVTRTAYYEITKVSLTGSGVTFTNLPNVNYNGKAHTPTVVAYHDGRRLVENKDYTVRYEDNTYPGRASAFVRGMGYYVGERELRFSVLAPAMTGLNATAVNQTAITLNWARTPNVTGYRITYKLNGVQKSVSVLDPKQTITISGLESGTLYEFTAQPYINANGTTYYGQSQTVSGVTGVGTTDVTGNSPSKGASSIGWTKVKGATGYMIYRAETKEGPYEKVANLPATYNTYTDSGLLAGNVYYYRVRPYIRLENKDMIYGSYSEPVGVKIK